MLWIHFLSSGDGLLRYDPCGNATRLGPEDLLGCHWPPCCEQGLAGRWGPGRAGGSYSGVTSARDLAGEFIEMSHELGSGFVSSLGQQVGLSPVLKEQRDLLVIVKGTTGVGALSSLMNYHKIGLFALKRQVGCAPVYGKVQLLHRKRPCVRKSTVIASQRRRSLRHLYHVHITAALGGVAKPMCSYIALGCPSPQITVIAEFETVVHDPIMDEQCRWRSAHDPNVMVIPVLQKKRGSGPGELERVLFQEESAAELCPRLKIRPEACAVRSESGAGGGPGCGADVCLVWQVLIAGMAKRRKAMLIDRLVSAGVSPYRILCNDLG
jgi:hypothetical protein